MKKELHPKIKELQLRASPVNTYSNTSVDSKGELVSTDTSNVIKGYACVWGVPDDYGTVWIKGAFSKSIQERGPSSNSKYKIVGLWQHKQCDPIGRVTTLTEDDYGLYFEIELDEFDAVPSAKRAAAQVKSGTINNFSFGFDYVWDKMEYDTATGNVLMYEGELWEISPVTIGSQIETYAIRGKEDFAERKLDLDEETEDFIKAIPRGKQLELRQLLTRHIALTRQEPPELRQQALKQSKPPEAGDKMDISKLKTIF